MDTQIKKINSNHVYERLKILLGNWSGKRSDETVDAVTYRLIAGGSALVETWKLASGSEAMTIYSENGNNLVATHYCPQRNQPRLRLAAELKNGRLSFEFYDGANTDNPGVYHQHQFDLLILSENAFERGEMYLCNSNGKSNYESVKYFRV